MKFACSPESVLSSPVSTFRPRSLITSDTAGWYLCNNGRIGHVIRELTHSRLNSRGVAGSITNRFPSLCVLLCGAINLSLAFVFLRHCSYVIIPASCHPPITHIPRINKKRKKKKNRQQQQQLGDCFYLESFESRVRRLESARNE